MPSRKPASEPDTAPNTPDLVSESTGVDLTGSGTPGGTPDGPAYLARCYRILRTDEVCSCGCGSRAPAWGLPHTGCHILGPLSPRQIAVATENAAELQSEAARYAAKFGEKWGSGC